MNRVFILLASLVLVLSVGRLCVKNAQQQSKSSAEIFLNEIQLSNRYLSTDEIAKRIIDGDPTLFLVDVRNEDEFTTYSLPGAMNIPLQKILNDEWTVKLNTEVLDVIFFSNDDIVSEQAWAVCKQQGYSNLYVLDGGLNKWFATIMLPEEPSELASTEEMDLFSFRKGASIYFGSGTITIPIIIEVEEEIKPEPVVKKTIPVKKKVKAEAEGGC